MPKTPKKKPEAGSVQPAGGPPRWMGWAWSLGGGAAGALAFEPFGLRALIPLAPLGLFLAARTAPSAKSAMARVLAGAFVHYMIAICWLLTLGHYTNVAPLGVAPAGIVGLAFYTAWYPMLAAGFVRRFHAQSHPFIQFAAFAAAWIFGEWFHTLWWFAMPWALLGQAWAAWPWAVQWADCFGEIGVSAQILLVAGLLFCVARTAIAMRFSSSNAPEPPWISVFFGKGEIDPELRSMLASIALAIALASIFWTSSLKMKHWEERLAAEDGARALRVACVQPNIDQDTKLASYMSEDEEEVERLQEICNARLEGLIGGLKEDTDLIVAPETAFSSFYFSVDRELHARIERMMEAKACDFLFGADRLEVEYGADGTGHAKAMHNAAWFLPRGDRVANAKTQDKMRLVPFGESGFTAGKRVAIFETHGAKFGALICYESSFGSQARKIVLAGAQFLAVITNDAWYFESAGPKQHHDLSILRAIETRRPIVRCANTGISSIINPAGRVEATLALGKQGVVEGKIVPRSGRTFFARWGNFWLAVVSAAWIAAAVALRIRRGLAVA